MKNRIIALILTLTTLFSVCAVTVSAAREETFISEVALVYEDSVEDAREAIKGTDWNLLEHNLNSKADYIFDNGDEFFEGGFAFGVGFALRRKIEFDLGLGA